jgi:hypothetical protein
VVHLPAFDTQQLRYLAIAVAPISLRQPDQGEPESIIIFSGRLWYCRELRDRPITRQVRRSDVASFWRVWITA